MVSGKFLVCIGTVGCACSLTFASNESHNSSCPHEKIVPTKISVVVKKEKVPSTAVLNQEASELIGEMIKTSAELVTDLGTLQTSCLSSLERVLDGGMVTKIKVSPDELKKCVESLRTHNNSLKKLKEEVSDSRAFCSALF